MVHVVCCVCVVGVVGRSHSLTIHVSNFKVLPPVMGAHLGASSSSTTPTLPASDPPQGKVKVEQQQEEEGGGSGSGSGIVVASRSRMMAPATRPPLGYTKCSVCVKSHRKGALDRCWSLHGRMEVKEVKEEEEEEGGGSGGLPSSSRQFVPPAAAASAPASGPSCPHSLCSLFML